MSNQLLLPAAVGADPNAQAEAALQRLVAFRNAWPRPADGAGVRADSLLSVLKYLWPLSDMVLKLEVGMSKVGYLGVGYLTGSKVTRNDHIIAAFIWDEVNGRLPLDGQKPVHPKRYNRIKEAAYQLLAIATDLDIGVNALQKTGTAATTAWDKIRSLSVVPLTGAEAVGAAPRVPRYVRKGSYILVTHDRRRRFVTVDKREYDTALDARVAASEDGPTGLQQWKRRNPPTELEDVADLCADWKDKPERGGVISEDRQHEIDWVRHSPDDNVRQYVIWSGVYRDSGAEVGDEPVMEFNRGDLVESIPDNRLGTVECVSCGPAGCHYGIRFANDRSVVRTGEQLRAAKFKSTAVNVGSFDVTQAQQQMQQLVTDLIALKRVIEIKENYDKIMATDPSFVPQFEAYIKNLEGFGKQLSGADIAWYNIPKKAVHNLSLVTEGTATFNTIRDYRQKFNEMNAKVDAMLGAQALAYKPTSTPAPKEDKSPGEQMGEFMKFMTTAVVVGGVALGGALLLSVLRK